MARKRMCRGSFPCRTCPYQKGCPVRMAKLVAVQLWWQNISKSRSFTMQSYCLFKKGARLAFQLRKMELFDALNQTIRTALTGAELEINGGRYA